MTLDLDPHRLPRFCLPMVLSIRMVASSLQRTRLKLWALGISHKPSPLVHLVLCFSPPTIVVFQTRFDTQQACTEPTATVLQSGRSVSLPHIGPKMPELPLDITSSISKDVLEKDLSYYFGGDAEIVRKNVGGGLQWLMALATRPDRFFPRVITMSSTPRVPRTCSRFFESCARTQRHGEQAMSTEPFVSFGLLLL